MTEALEGLRPNISDSDLVPGAAAASISGDGARLGLAAGQVRELKFTVRNIVRVEIAYRSHANFLLELQTMPLAVLSWVLVNCCKDVQDVDAALALLDDVNWRPLLEQVQDAWEAAMPPIPPESEREPDPTRGS